MMIRQLRHLSSCTKSRAKIKINWQKCQLPRVIHLGSGSGGFFMENQPWNPMHLSVAWAAWERDWIALKGLQHLGLPLDSQIPQFGMFGTSCHPSQLPKSFSQVIGSGMSPILIAISRMDLGNYNVQVLDSLEQVLQGDLQSDKYQRTLYHLLALNIVDSPKVDLKMLEQVLKMMKETVPDGILQVKDVLGRTAWDIISTLGNSDIVQIWQSINLPKPKDISTPPIVDISPHQELINQIDQLKTSHEQDRKTWEMSMDKLTDQLENTNNLLSKSRTSQSNLRQEIVSLRLQLEEKIQQLSDITSKYDHQSNLYSSITQDFKQLLKETQSLKSRLKSVEQMALDSRSLSSHYEMRCKELQAQIQQESRDWSIKVMNAELKEKESRRLLDEMESKRQDLIQDLVKIKVESDEEISKLSHQLEYWKFSHENILDPVRQQLNVLLRELREASESLTRNGQPFYQNLKEDVIERDAERITLGDLHLAQFSSPTDSTNPTDSTPPLTDDDFNGIPTGEWVKNPKDDIKPSNDEEINDRFRQVVNDSKARDKAKGRETCRDFEEDAIKREKVSFNQESVKSYQEEIASLHANLKTLQQTTFELRQERDGLMIEKQDLIGRLEQLGYKSPLAQRITESLSKYDVFEPESLAKFQNNYIKIPDEPSQTHVYSTFPRKTIPKIQIQSEPSQTHLYSRFPRHDFFTTHPKPSSPTPPPKQTPTPQSHPYTPKEWLQLKKDIRRLERENKYLMTKVWFSRWFLTQESSLTPALALSSRFKINSTKALGPLPYLEELSRQNDKIRNSLQNGRRSLLRHLLTWTTITAGYGMIPPEKEEDEDVFLHKSAFQAIVPMINLNQDEKILLAPTENRMEDVGIHRLKKRMELTSNTTPFGPSNGQCRKLSTVSLVQTISSKDYPMSEFLGNLPEMIGSMETSWQDLGNSLYSLIGQTVITPLPFHVINTLERLSQPFGFSSPTILPTKYSIEDRIKLLYKISIEMLRLEVDIGIRLEDLMNLEQYLQQDFIIESEEIHQKLQQVLQTSLLQLQQWQQVVQDWQLIEPMEKQDLTTCLNQKINSTTFIQQHLTNFLNKESSLSQRLNLVKRLNDFERELEICLDNLSSLVTSPVSIRSLSPSSFDLSLSYSFLSSTS